MKDEPLVCVLTPVYNGEEFLEECIESVLKQTYNNWELVLVNNKSTDGSLDIMEKYVTMDERIRIHNNREFLPQMENLNHAFRQTTKDSKYCKVLHADDWMFPECLSRMIELAEEFPQVGIVNSYYLDDTIVRPQGLPYPSTVLSGRSVSAKYLTDHHTYFGAPSNLLIKSEIILNRDEVYDPENIHSDHAVCLDILKEYDFGFVHQVLTYSRRHPDSHTNQVAEKYRTYKVGKIKCLMEHGPYYLGPDVTEELLNETINDYYRSFIRRSVYGFSKKHYDFHIKKISEMGLSVDYLKVLRHFLIAMIDVRVVYSYINKKIR